MINLVVTGQKLKVTGNLHIVADSVNYIEFNVQYPSDWETKRIFAQLTAPDGRTIEREFINGVIDKSSGLNLGEGAWKLMLHADTYDSDGMVVERITTNEIQLNVKPSGLKDSEEWLPEYIGSISVEIIDAIVGDLPQKMETVSHGLEKVSGQVRELAQSIDYATPIIADVLPAASADNHTRFAIIRGDTERLFINLKNNGLYMWYELKQGGEASEDEPVEDGLVEDSSVLGVGKIGQLVLGKVV